MNTSKFILPLILLLLSQALVINTFAQIEESCFAPGTLVIDEESETDVLPYFDIEKVFVAEPIFGDNSDKLVFTLKVKDMIFDLEDISYPQGSWNVVFTGEDGIERFVRMSTTLQNPTFSYGKVTYLLGIPRFNEEGSITGTFNNDGTVSLPIDKYLIGNPAIGTNISISGKTYLNTLGVGLVETDSTTNTNYTIVGNSDCSPYQFVQYGVNGDIPVQADYTRNGTSDYAVWKQDTGMWNSLDGVTLEENQFQWGSRDLGDIPITGNFDNDRISDYAVYRPQEGNWYIYMSETNTYKIIQFGIAEDIPLAGDYDGDRIDDLAIFRPSNGVWYILNSFDNTTTIAQFGMSEDRPFVGDYDGDRRADFSVFRPSTGVWYSYLSDSNNFQAIKFGFGTDTIVPADYDGDNKTDWAVFRPEDGVWHILKSDGFGYESRVWGLSTDKPVPGDYNGNGRADLTVWRPENGVWYTFFN